MGTAIAFGSQLVQPLVDLPLLEFPDDLHVLLADGIFLEIVEFGSIVREVEEVDSSLVLLIEFLYVLFHVLVEPAYHRAYLASRTIFSVSSFFEFEAAHLSTSSCLICIVFS